MSEMVERVARTIDPGAYISAGFEGGSARWNNALHVARAAIEAMREPTDEMVIAGDNEAIDVLNDHTFALKEPTLAARVHRAMIDAALK